MSTLPGIKQALPRLVEKVHLRPPELPEVLVRQLPRIIEPLASLPPFRRLASKLVINHYSYATSLRPRALTLESDYTTWATLTDRRFTGRHLPPADPEAIAALPAESDVNALFRREREIKSTDTSVWFMFFAQWFTDSFLRTSRDDFRQNTSTQEIDLCQIYGLGADQTRMLRSLNGGKLQSQQINSEEFPVFLFQKRDPGAPLAFKPEFDGLFDERFVIDTILGSAPEESKDSVFAVGLEHGNATIGSTILNTLFLREHNRIAALLGSEYPHWDDDRLFETTRNIMIVLELKLVVEEYIRHIGPFDFAIEAVPFIADEERWNRPNWIAIEFNLLYRWHSLVPEVIGEGPQALTWQGFLNNNPLVISRGLESLVALCSKQRAGKIGLLNTPAFLVDRSVPDHPSLEERTIALMRQARLRSFNDYREAYGLPRMKTFADLTSNVVVRERLETLYHGDIESLEWYVGIFAEEYPDYLMMGELLTTMVANDAFTQALSNPLLARNVFNEATFSSVGMQVINETKSLLQIL
ncbi:MAG: prostaglandin-endoperoxide synthase 2, partial [Actinomycetota bacterium]|nr:prostaglandin-endoperoxide synthase 2 [Actinomycetota bacterium]